MVKTIATGFFWFAAIGLMGSTITWLIGYYWKKSSYHICVGGVSLVALVAGIALALAAQESADVRTLGIALAVLSVMAGFAWFGYKGDPSGKSQVVALSTLGVILGVLFVFGDRVQEVGQKDDGGWFARLQTATTQAEDLIQKLEEQSNFHSILLRAQNNDRKAYESLLAYIQHEEPAVASLAKSVRTTIWEKYRSESGRTLSVNPLRGHDLTKTTPEELLPLLRITPNDMKHSFIRKIWGRDDLSAEAKLTFLEEVIEKTENLWSLYAAVELMSEYAKIKHDPFDYSKVLVWWKEKKESFNR